MTIIRRAALVIATASTIVAGCATPPPEPSVEERAARAEADLVDSGASPAVAACVVRLARHDLRVGPLDDLTADELLLSCERAQAVLEAAGDGEGGTGADTLAFVEGPDTLGDDPMLDELWRLCESGLGAACEELFETAPVGSDYERFGVSCGERDEVLRCAELDEADGTG